MSGNESLVNKIHLIYLGVLPSLATFAMLYNYGYRWPALLFIGGTAITGVHLSYVYHYTRPPASLPMSVWALIDGPLFALAARGSRSFNLSFAIEGFLIDGLALWLAILALTLVSPLPTPGERVASLGISLVSLGVMVSFFWPYISGMWQDWSWLMWSVIGVVEGEIGRYRLLEAEETARSPSDEGSILYIALLTVLWVIAMNVGVAVHGGQ